MSDLETAIHLWSMRTDLSDREALILDAARRFASLTSPETIEKAAVALAKKYPSTFGGSYAAPREVALTVLRSVEEGKT